MRLSARKGFSFGLTSGVITTLGLIVGLHSSTHSALAVTGGILVIAIADALSDAVGIHVSEESENMHSVREVWESTLATFVSKFAFALSFIIPVLLFPLSTAVAVSVVWGLALITVFSYHMAGKGRACRVILEHLAIAVLVIIVTYYVGEWVAVLFG